MDLHDLEHVYKLKEVNLIYKNSYTFILQVIKNPTDRIQKRARVRVKIVHVLVHVADLNLSIRGMNKYHITH